MINFSSTKHANELLTEFINHDGFLTFSQIENSLKIKRRSIFYLIKQINTELENHDQYPIDNIHGQGYRLNPSTIDFIINSFNSNQSYSIIDATTGKFKFPKLPSNKRQHLIGIILISRQSTSLSNLMIIFNASKNTIIHDLRVLNNELKQHYDLSITNTPKGKEIVGLETSQRRFVFENLPTLIETCSISTDDRIDHEIIQHLSLFQRITGNYYTDEADAKLAGFLTWYLHRIKDSHHLITNAPLPSDELKNTWVQSFLHDFNITPNQEESFLVPLLTSQPLRSVNHHEPIIKKLTPITKAIIDNFNHIALTDVTKSNPKLIKNLTQHLATAYYRITNNYSATNPLTTQIITEYPLTYNFTKQAIAPFEKLVNAIIPKDEIALIATYFAGSMRRIDLKPSITRNQVMIVCSSGIGTSQLLLNNLTNLFPAINFTGPISLFQLESRELDKTSLIISTIDLPNKYDRIPSITVPPIISEDTYHQIKSKLVQLQLLISDEKLTDIPTIIDIIANYTRIVDPTGLEKALTTYFSLGKTSLNLVENPSNTISPVIFTNFSHQVLSWKDAIKVSCQRLIEQQIVTDQYPNAIIDLTNRYGDYMSIGHGILLAHASPKDGVNQYGLDFNYFHHPFSISDENKPIYLVVTLAPVDQTAHTPFLNALMTAINDKNWLNKLASLNGPHELVTLLDKSGLLKF